MSRLLEEFLAFVQSKGLHKARSREQIAQVFFASSKHITVSEIWDRARKINPSIGIATVYRTMNLLVESGLAERRDFADGMASYEKRPDHHHDHLLCKKCGTIVEFENDEIEELQKKVAKKHGFQLLDHKMELYGLCPGCSRKNSK